jgi:Concanavalin A-like lectin/glucanases superfamily
MPTPRQETVMSQVGRRRARVSRCLTAVMLLAFAVALAAAPAALADHSDLQGQWHLDEGARSDDSVSFTPDSSGHGLWPVVRYTSEVPGRFDKAFRYSTGSLTQLDSTPLLQPAHVTAIAWVRRAGSPGAYRYVVAQGSGSACPSSAYGLYTSYEGIASEGGMGFYVTSGVTAYHAPGVAPGAVWDGDWHMVAGTFDGSTVRFYFDGHEVGSGTAVLGPINYAQEDTRFRIGRYGPFLTEPCAEVTSFDGDIDEVRIYRRALSASEIAALAADTWTTPPPVGAEPPPPPPSDPAQAGGLAARYSVAPNPTCVDTPTVLDARSSTAGPGGPIVDYHFAYAETSVFGPASVSPIVLASSPSPVATVTFPWSHQASTTSPARWSRVASVWVREPAVVTLTVTDASGATATARTTVNFAQTSRTGSRAGCPEATSTDTPAPSFGTDPAVSGRYDLVVQAVCISTTWCTGDVVVTLPSLWLEAQYQALLIERENLERRRANQEWLDQINAEIRRILAEIDRMRRIATPVARRPKRRPRADVIAYAPYRIAPGARAVVRARLGKRARRVLRRVRRLRATVSILALTPQGRRVARRRAVTLKVPRGKPTAGLEPATPSSRGEMKEPW